MVMCDRCLVYNFELHECSLFVLVRTAKHSRVILGSIFEQNERYGLIHRIVYFIHLLLRGLTFVG